MWIATLCLAEYIRPLSNWKLTTEAILPPTFLVLDFGLHIIDRVRCLHIKSDGLSGKSFYEDLHTESKNKKANHGKACESNYSTFPILGLIEHTSAG